MGVLVFGDSVATVVATIKLAKSYDRALRPKPEPIDSIEEDLPC